MGKKRGPRLANNGHGNLLFVPEVGALCVVHRSTTRDWAKGAGCAKIGDAQEISVRKDLKQVRLVLDCRVAHRSGAV